MDQCTVAIAIFVKISAAMENDYFEVDENYSHWCMIPEPVFIEILTYLSAKSILNVGECCCRWNDISKDNYLWKKMFRRDFPVDRKIELRPGKVVIFFFVCVRILNFSLLKKIVFLKMAGNIKYNDSTVAN